MTGEALLGLAIMCCQHPSSKPSLLHPEQLVTLEEGSEWPRQITNGQSLRYPPSQFSVEAPQLDAIVVEEHAVKAHRVTRAQTLESIAIRLTRIVWHRYG